MVGASQSLLSKPPCFPLFRHRTVSSCSPTLTAAQFNTAASKLAAAHLAASPPLPPADFSATATSGPPTHQQWPGLREWRRLDADLRTVWGAKGPIAPQIDETTSVELPPSLAACGRQVLQSSDPRRKAALTFAAWRAFKAGTIPVGAAEPLDGPPARPAKPELVPPRQIPPMDKTPLPKTVYMLHNLAHVELNAVDLAWDTLVRFSSFGLPLDFYADFARVADDESRHLSWCLQRLEELGYGYGCMDAHNLLWEGCDASAHDLGARMAIIPMGQEARGLDAGDRLAKRLVGMGDNRTAAIVRRIATEERAHVAVGITWYTRICAALGAEPGPSFQKFTLTLAPGLLKGPFNDAERQEVGLPQEWYSKGLWEEQMRHAAAEAVACVERGGKPAQLAASLLGGGAELAPVDDPDKLHQLAARVAVLLDMEAAAAS